MPILYVNNFRGFEDTYIPLKDVNFLVGENSTGKTSILSLIKLLSDHTFWFTFDFSTDEVDLGFFKEIVSQNNGGIKSFNIGFFKEKIETSGAGTDFEIIYLSFKNKNGVPWISELNYIHNNQDIRVVLTKNKLKYKVIPINTDDVTQSNALAFFTDWINSIKDSNRTGFSFANEELSESRPKSIYLIKSIIEEQMNPRNQETDYGASIPIFIDDLNWTGPIRAKPKRIYENYNIHYSPEGEHAPHILKSILKSKKAKTKEIFLKYIEPFGQKSNLFQKIAPKSYGNNRTAPYELNITLSNQDFKISNVGYGVSQVLPIMTDLVARLEDSWFSIQQPEVHLHPKAQAALGELIFDIHLDDNKKFIIETHSEYLINRFRIKLSKNKKDNIQSQILFFERCDTGNSIRIIEIQTDGNYTEDQPASFSDFFINEEFELLGM